ncbi:MAG: acyl-CoA dehydrogenase family protein [Ketobacteraceae bacterium]|nr:acyl-CoA dehydrogenase family protein [Ketobacteraceae bacterium]
MSRPPIGYALAAMNTVATSQWIDKLGLRSTIEKLTYHGTKSGFQAIGAASRQFKNLSKQSSPERLEKPKGQSDLFDLTITDEQQMMKETVSRFAKDVVRPSASAADAAEATPADIIAQANELGLTYFAIPEALGGAATEYSTVTNMIVAEELAKGDLGIAVAILSPISVANAITRWGTGEQQGKYLAAFLEDKPLQAAIAVNEPSALFDPNNLKTTAQFQGDQVVLNGEKTLVPLIETAELFLVAANTGSRGTQIFIVESSTDGVTIEKTPAMGLKPANVGTLVLQNVKLPKSAMLGAGDFNYQEFLNLARLNWCALACGTAQAVLDYTIEYCNDRVAFGEPISHRQSVAFMIANIGIELEGMRVMTQRAAALAERGKDFQREAYLARIFCSDKAMEIGTNGVQLLGGHGFTKEHPVERWYRDLRSIAVMEGGLHL